MFFSSFILLPSSFSCLSLSGDEGTRTLDFLLAKEALSQLSYIPIKRMNSEG
jgi:hypothetical protein